MFLWSLVKLNNFTSVWEFAPKIRCRGKKGLRRILVLFQFGILDFLLPSGYYLPKNQGGHIYFALFRVRPEGVPPPQIDAYEPVSFCWNQLIQMFRYFKANLKASLVIEWDYWSLVTYKQCLAYFWVWARTIWTGLLVNPHGDHCFFPGRISHREISEALHSCGIEVTAEEAKKITQRFEVKLPHSDG